MYSLAILCCFVFFQGLWSTIAVPLKSSSLSDFLMMPLDHGTTPTQQGASVAKDYDLDYYDVQWQSKPKYDGRIIAQAEASRRVFLGHGKRYTKQPNSTRSRHPGFKHPHRNSVRYRDRMKRGKRQIGPSAQVEVVPRPRRELPDRAVHTDTDSQVQASQRMARHWPIVFRSTTHKPRTHTTVEYICGSTACRSDGRRSHQNRDFLFLQKRPLSKSSEEYICGSVGCRNNVDLQDKERAKLQLDPTQARVLGSARMHRDAHGENKAAEGQPGGDKQEALLATKVDINIEDAEVDALLSHSKKRMVAPSVIKAEDEKVELPEDAVMDDDDPIISDHKKTRQSDAATMDESEPSGMSSPVESPNPVQPAAAMSHETKEDVPSAVVPNPKAVKEDHSPGESQVQKRSPIENGFISGVDKVTTGDFKDHANIREKRGIKMAAVSDLSKVRLLK